MSEDIVPLEFIASKIYIVRGHKVMLDSDLASLYGVTTKNLNQAVSRNLDSFPPDFMYKLKAGEQENLRFQIGTSRWGGRRYLPYVFTHNGVSMLSSVLKSKRARQSMSKTEAESKAISQSETGKYELASCANEAIWRQLVAKLGGRQAGAFLRQHVAETP